MWRGGLFFQCGPASPLQERQGVVQSASDLNWDSEILIKPLLSLSRAISLLSENDFPGEVLLAQTLFVFRKCYHRVFLEEKFVSPSHAWEMTEMAQKLGAALQAAKSLV